MFSSDSEKLWVLSLPGHSAIVGETLDRVKSAFLGLARSAHPKIDYYAMYRARVQAQTADLSRLDVVPEDPRIPPMSRVRIKQGVPGVQAQVPVGSYVLIGWDGANPTKRFAALWDDGSAAGGGSRVVRLVLHADTLQLAADTARVDARDMQVSALTSTVEILGSAKIVSPAIELGEGVMDLVVKGRALQSVLSDLFTALATHSHPAVLSGPPDPGTVSALATAASSLPTAFAENVAVS